MNQTNSLVSFMHKVYGWMFVGLLLTAVTAYFVSTSDAILNLLISNAFVFYGLLILELVLVFGLSAMVNKISASVATFIFLIYAVLNGVTFSIVLLAYTGSSIAVAFFVTAGVFGIMSLYGYITKKDLTTLGHFAMMALVGLIIASLANLFFNSSAVDWIVTYAGVLIFIALTAYDTQKIKRLYSDSQSWEGQEKESVIGALTLYLDFINLFLDFLRIFGKSRD
jgi:FtsH-binding integral membrane protein